MFIGYIIELDERTESVKIETGNGYVQLSKEFFDFQQQLDFYKESVPEDEFKQIDELKQKGVIAHAESVEELYEAIKHLFPIRQGVIYKSEENSYIILGNQPIEVVKFQLYIWKGANGNRSINDIFAKGENKELTKESDILRSFVECVAGLVRAGVLFLRN